MIKRDTFTNIEEIEEVFQNEIVIKKVVLYKPDSIDNPYATNRYAEFIDEETSIKINGTRFDSYHFMSYEPNEKKLYIKHIYDYSIKERNLLLNGEQIDEIDEIDDIDDYNTFEIKKYFIEGREGIYWNLIDNYFWIWGDLPPEPEDYRSIEV
jgi:hypothetical protein